MQSKKPINIQIGQNIRQIREDTGLTQEKLAEMLEIAQNTLSYIETGNHFCTAETIEKLITALNIEPHELFTFEHFKSNEELIKEINKILEQNPAKITEFYKILKAMTN